MTKEQLLRPAQYACFIGSLAGFGLSVKGLGEVSYFSKEIENQKTPLVEKYRREWANSQTNTQLTNFVIYDHVRQLRDEFVGQQIIQNHPEITDLANQRDRSNQVGGVGSVMAFVGLFSGMSLLGHRTNKEIYQRRMQRVKGSQVS